MPYATYDTITTADKSNDPSWVHITDAEYLALLDGMMNGRQVSIKSNGMAGLRTPEPPNWNGSNYAYDEETDTWAPIAD